jgi:hypothetical protein
MILSGCRPERSRTVTPGLGDSGGGRLVPCWQSVVTRTSLLCQVSGLGLGGPLPEREHVCLGAGLQERDLQGPGADRVVHAHELVQAAVGEHAVPVRVDVQAV